MVTDDTGKTKKLWCHSQQACQDWCNFLSQWAQKQVLLSHWYHIQWNKILGRSVSCLTQAPGCTITLVIASTVTVTMALNITIIPCRYTAMLSKTAQI